MLFFFKIDISLYVCSCKIKLKDNNIQIIPLFLPRGGEDKARIE